MPLCSSRPQQLEPLAHQPAERHVLGRVHHAPDPAELEQVVEQAVHLVGGGDDAAEVLANRVVAARREVPAREPGEAADRHERRLEVVRHGVVEALELGVLGREIAALRAQRLLVGAQVPRHPVERARQVAELVRRVERERMVEVPRRDLRGRTAHLRERPRERAREQQAHQQAHAERGEQHERAEREQRGAVPLPQLRRALLLEPAQRGFPGRLGKRDDAPAGRDAAGRHAEAQLGDGVAADQHRVGSVPWQRARRALAVHHVRRGSVGQHEAVAVDDQERDHRQPRLGLLDRFVEPLDVELVERVEQVQAQVARGAVERALVVRGAGRRDRVAQLLLQHAHAQGDRAVRRSVTATSASVSAATYKAYRVPMPLVRISGRATPSARRPSRAPPGAGPA